MKATPLESSYLTNQLPAYIGNKRRLLPFLEEVFSQLLPELHSSRPRPSTPGSGKLPPLRFLDPFAGTGSVARLAKMMGMAVYANDWEPYAQVLCRAYLYYDADHKADHEPEFTRIRERINQLYTQESGKQYASQRDQPGYIQRWFAPFDTQNPRIGRERLFYTQENARYLDAARQYILTRIPGNDSLTQDLLLALLLYEAATHANTSGLFKAYHRGFGGLGRDALSRIMFPMELEDPVLINRPETRGLHVVTGVDAVAAAEQAGRVDIAYLDPPYNIHQYGSNYFMLNSIVLWDQPPAPLTLDARGELIQKAGIRGDWIATRSDYCSRPRAYQAMHRLLEALDCRFIVLSYNTEGVIPQDTLLGLLSRYGSVQTAVQPYTTYRGGRQSPRRSVNNHELVLVVDTQGKTGRVQVAGLEDLARRRRVDRIVRAVFDPEQIRSRGVDTWLAERKIIMPGQCAFQHPRIAAQVLLEDETADPVIALLESLLVEDYRTRVELIFTVLQGFETSTAPVPKSHQTKLHKLLVASLGKFAFKKYREDYLSWYDRLHEACGLSQSTLPSSRGFRGLGERLEALDRRVRSRL